jgi:hypothetical protein
LDRLAGGIVLEADMGDQEVLAAGGEKQGHGDNDQEDSVFFCHFPPRIRLKITALPGHFSPVSAAGRIAAKNLFHNTENAAGHAGILAAMICHVKGKTGQLVEINFFERPGRGSLAWSQTEWVSAPIKWSI